MFCFPVIFSHKENCFTKGLQSTHYPGNNFFLKESWTFSSDSACFLGTCQFSFEDNRLIFVHGISRNKLCSIKLIQEPRDIGGAIMVARDLMYFPIKWSAKEPQESSKSQGSQGPHNIRVSIGVINIPQVQFPHVASPFVWIFFNFQTDLKSPIWAVRKVVWVMFCI